MNKFVKRLPLPAKLLLLALIPFLFIAYLTMEVYVQKSANIHQLKGHIDRLHLSGQLTRLIDELQEERRLSFHFALEKEQQSGMLRQRPATDSILNQLNRSADPALQSFETYTSLHRLDSVRQAIDRGQSPANYVMHFYSNTIFRLNTLNGMPGNSSGWFKSIYADVAAQRLLSEMVTYLGLINANIYNVLYTKQYQVETLLGTLGTYDVLQSYEKELLIKASPQTSAAYRNIRNKGTLQPVMENLHRIFSTFRLDSGYTYQSWAAHSGRAINQLRGLQLSVLKNVEAKVTGYYRQELASRTRAVLLLVLVTALLIGLVTYILFSINSSLKQLEGAATRLASGATNVPLKIHTQDAIGSLARSIRHIDENNRKLAFATGKIGMGEFDVPVAPRSTDDLLGNAVVQMKDRLRTFTTDLKNSREQFRQLAEFMPQIVWTATPGGEIDYFNRRWLELVGSHEDENWIMLLHPDDVGPYLQAWRHAVRTGTPFELECRFRERNGQSWRWFLSRAVPVRNEAGAVVRWFGTCTDIQDQKLLHEKLEELVAQRTEALKRSNEDLQQFAHVASHDLKEPLRKMKMFSNRLEAEYSTVLPDKGKTYVDKIQASADRMTSLIESVLNYSVVNATGEVAELVDLSLIIEGIESDLELLIIQKNARIVRNGLPRIHANPALIYQLFYNLLNNALKFSKENVPAEISITAESAGNGTQPVPGFSANGKNFFRITVCDNGIGFNPAFADKMFHVFTRLNAREKYEGTGLGLALCKKIVERHHGFIYAEGVEGEGACFYILLPENSDG